MRVARLPFVFSPLLLMASTCVPQAFGQTSDISPDLEEGMKPYGAFHGGDIDQVSLSSGKLVLNIPLISYPQRGGKIKVGFSLHWLNITPRLTEVCFPAFCREQAFRDASTYQTARLYTADNLAWSAAVTAPLGNLPVADLWAPDQSFHQNVEVGQTYQAIDATGLAFNSSTATLMTNDGLRYTYTTNSSGVLSKVEDPNGNFVTPTMSNGQRTGWIDTLGRSIPLGGTSTTDYSHCTGANPIAGASTWTVPGPNGGTETFKFCSANYSYYWTFDTGNGTAVFHGTLSMLQSIVLPNLTTWTFGYDPVYASLSQITLPTGGTISYTWSLQSADCQFSQSYNNQNESTTTKFGWYLAITSRTVNANDGTGNHTWIYSGTPVGGTTTTVTITDPLGNDSTHSMTGLAGTASIYETQAQYFQGSASTGTLLKTVKTDFSWNANDPWNTSTAPTYCKNVASAVPIRVTTTWPSGPVTKQETDYDSGFSTSFGNYIYGLTIAQREYDYGNGTPGPLLRRTNTAYMWQSNPNYLTANLLDLSSQVVTYNGSGSRVAETDSTYDNPSYLQSSGITTQHEAAPGPVRGNLSTTQSWVNTTNSFITSTTTLFDTGTVPNDTDPLSHPVNRAYSTSFAGAFPTTVTNAFNQSASHNYDFNTGLLISTTDPNNLTTSFTYDNMWRLASVTAPDGAVSTITHQEATPPFTTTLNKPINPSQTETTTHVFDGLGRLTQSQLNSDPQGTVYTDTTYDALGRVATVSNPHRTCGSDATSSCGTTTYGYDALARKTSETYPDGSVLTTAYCGPSTLVTDPTGKWRRSRVDGLGRLVEVDEPNSPTATVASTGCPGTGEPIWVTTYGYDTLGNLTSVVQNGSHQRSFVYDSLSRLLTSTNPEVGTINYSYNNDGVLISKTDARGITTNYSPSDSPIDVLHRVTKVTYSNGDPSLTFTYDQTNCLGLSSCQNIGHRTSMTDAAGSEAWSFQVDAANHRSVHVEQRTTNSITKTSTYYLDQAGNVTQAVYPTGRVVNYTFDNADRPSTAVDGSNGITYATDSQTAPTGCLSGKVCYAPQGTFYALSIGQSSGFTGLNLTHTYNNRLQPNEFKASSTGGNAIDISYNFVDPSTNKNAGIVYGITNNIDTTRSQTFSYDQLNRITSALTTSTYSTGPSHCWGETYTLDAWANLNSVARTTNSAYTGCSQESGFSTTADGNNHLPLFGYDSSGNAQSDGSISYAWNGESQLKSATNGGTTTNYLYDGDGRRVSKVGSKLYWYGSGDDILAETDASGNTQNEYIFFGGKRIAVLPAGGSPSYYVEDLLGTSRVITTNSGVVCYDADFYPYGGERAYTNTCPQNYKFEGKERDTETGNDDFGARYYSNRFGRWLSADWSALPEPVPYANLSNPQTLNLYSMVSDDPESFADLDGHDDVMQNILRLAGSTPRDPNRGALNLAVGAAKGIANMVIQTINEVTGNGRPITGENGPRQPADAVPELELKNRGEAIGAIAGPALLGAVVGGVMDGASAGGAADSAMLKEVPESIPAGPSARPTAEQQGAINEMGEAHGCHTCGTTNPGTKSGNWVGDHQPPTAQNPPGGAQVYKPQCLQCSREQGGQVRAEQLRQLKQQKQNESAPPTVLDSNKKPHHTGGPS